MKMMIVISMMMTKHEDCLGYRQLKEDSKQRHVVAEVVQARIDY
jgi:hypothetical protein